MHVRASYSFLVLCLPFLQGPVLPQGSAVLRSFTKRMASGQRRRVGVGGAASGNSARCARNVTAAQEDAPHRPASLLFQFSWRQSTRGTTSQCNSFSVFRFLFGGRPQADLRLSLRCGPQVPPAAGR